MKINYFLKRKLDNNLIEVISPEEIVSTFDTLYGIKNAEEILQDVVTYFQDKKNAIKPYTSYGILGPHGTRKASLVFATAKSANIPVISLDASIFIAKEDNEVADIVNLIFTVAEKVKRNYNGCFIIIQNVHETEQMDNDTSLYLNLIREFRNTDDVFLFALSSCESWIVPHFVAQEGLFESTIVVDYPDLATREKIFESCIKKEKLNIASDVSINRLAKETYGGTQRSIEHIVKEAHLYSARHKHEVVTQSDFSETIMRLSAGEKDVKMTEKERKSTAYHEAGHVIAGYFANPEYVLQRVEISPRSQGSLGLTVTDIDESKYSYFRKDYEYKIISCLGGLCAEEVIYHTHTSGVVQDLITATSIAANMVKAYGMCFDFGFMAVIPNVTDSPATRERAEKEITKILDTCHQKAMQIMLHRIDYLHALAEALLEKEVVLGDEIKEIFDKVTKQREGVITLDEASKNV